MFEPVARELYLRPTVLAARALLGKLLVRRTNEGDIWGRIVETEAYLAQADRGNHAARRRTERNSPLFGPPGTTYVYRTYGVHSIMNAVTQPEGVPEAVLIRALEPLGGVELMRRHRRRDNVRCLARGPANVCAALAVGLSFTGHDLARWPLLIAEGDPAGSKIVTTTRVGISDPQAAALKLRYYLADNPFVSRR